MGLSSQKTTGPGYVRERVGVGWEWGGEGTSVVSGGSLGVEITEERSFIPSPHLIAAQSSGN